MDGDVMKMREIAGGLEIPAGGEVVLKPGGYMLAFAGTPPTPGEREDRLEQRRALDHGWPIRMVPVDWRGHGVDTPADLARARALLSDDSS